VTPTPLACPDENALAAFAEGRLAGSAHDVLEAHLDACAACLAIVCEIVRSAEDIAAVDPDGTLTAPLPPGEGSAPIKLTAAVRGARIGRYTLVKMIGQGGMGIVYAAEDTVLDRTVALKVLRSNPLSTSQGGREARTRLLREARAMAKVSHPNVVTVHDAGEADGGVFIAMELVEGVTLSAWLRAADRSWREVLTAFLAAGRGLAAAHAAKVIHRDFKPQNVLVNKSSRIAVTDFGLAVLPPHAVLPELNARASAIELTQPGILLGTPSYMSPEQLAGEKVDARTDQFSFAVALYEGLYKEKPFAGKTIEELSENVARGVVRDVRSGAHANVPIALRRALVRALRPHPDERFPDMEALLRELEEALGASDVRHRGRVRVAALVSALAVVAGAFAFIATRDGAAKSAPSSAPTAALPAPSEQTPSAHEDDVPAAPPATATAVVRLAQSAGRTVTTRAPRTFHAPVPRTAFDAGASSASEHPKSDIPSLRK
jgi:tRNA A-37 threonylcarbamoyl transferase component Bud32